MTSINTHFASSYTIEFWKLKCGVLYSSNVLNITSPDSAKIKIIYFTPSVMPFEHLLNLDCDLTSIFPLIWLFRYSCSIKVITQCMHTQPPILQFSKKNMQSSLTSKAQTQILWHFFSFTQRTLTQLLKPISNVTSSVKCS